MMINSHCLTCKVYLNTNQFASAQNQSSMLKFILTILITLIIDISSHSDFESYKETIFQEIESLKTETEYLHTEVYKNKAEVQVLKDKHSESDRKFSKIGEFIGHLNPPKTCQGYKQIGFESPSTYFVNPASSNQPIEATCNFPSGRTTIGETLESKIEYCHAPFCHQFMIQNENVLEQQAALVKLSKTCSQSIRFHCKSTPLKVSISH